jgi:hypothetical protein
MTFVVVAKGLAAEKGQELRRSTGEMLDLTSGVVKSLDGRFIPQSLTIWEEFPGEAMGGEIKLGPTELGPGQLDLRNLIPTSNRSFAQGTGNLQEAFSLQPHHCLVLKGRLKIRSGVDVPAQLDLNLYRPWAEKAGHLVLDTAKTSTTPYDGLYALLSHEEESVRRSILESLMTGVEALSHGVGGAAKVRWAAVKDTEGAVEPDFRSFLAMYRGYITGKHSLVVEAVREAAIERHPHAAGLAGDLPKSLVSAVVEDVVREIEGAPNFDPVATVLEEVEGITYVPGGSAYYILPDADAIARVAQRLLSGLGASIDRAVRQRLGEVNQWDEALSSLSRERAKRRGGLTE